MTEDPKIKAEDCLVVKCTKNEDLAKEIQVLFTSENIPFVIEDDYEAYNSEGISILVPEENLEEAQLLIDTRCSVNDFAAFIDPEGDFYDQQIDFEFYED